MERGYYWLHLTGQEPEVVEIDGDSMYRCGRDVTCRIDGEMVIEFGEPLDVFAITGPITPCMTQQELDIENRWLRRLLRQAAEHTRHPDYEWDVCFEREVYSAIEKANEPS